VTEESIREDEVRSAARRRAFAVAINEGRGGGGFREVVRVVRKSEEGGGRCCERIEDRS
jgi:hypothetical protein